MFPHFSFVSFRRNPYVQYFDPPLKAGFKKKRRSRITFVDRSTLLSLFIFFCFFFWCQSFGKENQIEEYKPVRDTMDSGPPQDPNDRRNDVNDHARRKEQPYDGRNRRNGGRDGQPMDVVGDLSESPVVVMMFLIGMASWLLRERCVC